MKKLLSKEKPTIFIFLVFLIFSLIKAFCLILNSDDLWWNHLSSVKSVITDDSPNGRYFTNIITYFMCNYTPLKILLYVSLMFLLMFVLGKLLSFSINENKWTSYFFSSIIILTVFYGFLTQIFNWISGFTNYVISIIFTLAYLLYCCPVFERNKLKNSVLSSVLWLIGGFFGSLCLESITFYNIVLALFVIVISIVLLKSVNFSNITFLIGSIAGAVLMFSDSTYSNLSQGVDEICTRRFQFDFTTWFHTLYNDLILFYSRKFFILHIIIAFSLVALCMIRFKDKEKQPKYLYLCLFGVILYAVFSCFRTLYGDFSVITVAYKERAIETAFTALYFFSLIYLVYSLFSGSKRIRMLIYLISTVVNVVPFFVANPITARCFFADYIFWGLFAFELMANLFNYLNVSGAKILIFSFSSVISCFIIMLSIMDISNKYVDCFRVKLIKEQMENDAPLIDFIFLPYPDLCSDIAEDFQSGSNTLFGVENEELSYTMLFCYYNDIDLSLLDKKKLYSSMFDYNMTHQEY